MKDKEKRGGFYCIEGGGMAIGTERSGPGPAYVPWYIKGEDEDEGLE